MGQAELSSRHGGCGSPPQLGEEDGRRKYKNGVGVDIAGRQVREVISGQQVLEGDLTDWGDRQSYLILTPTRGWTPTLPNEKF